MYSIGYIIYTKFHFASASLGKNNSDRCIKIEFIIHNCTIINCKLYAGVSMITVSYFLGNLSFIDILRKTLMQIAKARY
jgi:hypothetical protein